MEENTQHFLDLIRRSHRGRFKIYTLDTQRHLMGHLQLVVELGGRVHKVVSDNIALTIADFCREQQASVLCMGHPSLSMPRLLFRVGSYRKLLSELKEMSVDLIIVS